MANWTRQPQECSGTYMFSGHFLCTQTVKAKLTDEEIRAIYFDTLQAVKENNGLDYLQVFKNEQGMKLYFIASLNQEMIETGEYDLDDIDHNHCMLCFPEER
jgi:disulfide oxidoreductase YuzD